jgi:hypothetical protein
VNSPNLLFDNFSGALCRPGVLNKDPTVGLDGAIPANTCISHSFPGMHPDSHVTYPTPLASIKKLVKFGEINYYFLKSAKEFDKLTFGNSELVECKIWQNQNFDKPSNYGFSSSMMLQTNKLECLSLASTGAPLQ